MEIFNSLLSHITKMQDTVRLSISDQSLSNYDSPMSYAKTNAYRTLLKNTMLKSSLAEISVLLSKRFGTNIEVNTGLTSLSQPCYINIPVINYKTLNIALQDVDSLFPRYKKNKILWNTVASDSERKMFESMKSITSAIKDNSLNIDLEKNRIESATDFTSAIHLDILATVVLGLTPNEVVAVLLHEVGHLFAYFKYMTSTTNNHLILLDTFMKERFNGHKSPLDSFKVAMSKVGDTPKEDSPVAILETLNAYILKTYRMDETVVPLHKQLEVLADGFAVSLGYSDELSMALVKITSKGAVRGKKEKGESPAVSAIRIIMYLISIIFTILFFNIFGILFLLVLVGVKILQMVFSALYDIIATILNSISVGHVDASLAADTLYGRLKGIEQTLIAELRNSGNKLDKSIMADKVKFTKDCIKSIRTQYGMIDDPTILAYTPKELQENIIGSLTNNEFYYYSQLFRKE